MVLVIIIRPKSVSVSVAENQSRGKKWTLTILTLSNKTDTFLLGKFSSFSWFVHLNQCWAKFDGIIDANSLYWAVRNLVYCFRRRPGRLLWCDSANKYHRQHRRWMRQLYQIKSSIRKLSFVTFADHWQWTFLSWLLYDGFNTQCKLVQVSAINVDMWSDRLNSRIV